MSGRELEVSPSSPECNQGVPTKPAPAEAQSGGDAPLESDDLLIGRLLRGTYRIIAALDEGGMGKLYRAEHQRLRRPVAVKVMARALSANTEALARFRREAEIVSQLDHPHIVQILDFDTTEGGDPYIVMELLAGETLSRRLDQLRILPLRNTVNIVTQIASALTLAHRSGVVHRDLKPDNVVLLRMQDGSIFVKLLDFGISKGNPQSDSGNRKIRHTWNTGLHGARTGTIHGKGRSSSGPMVSGLHDIRDAHGSCSIYWGHGHSNPEQGSQ